MAFAFALALGAWPSVVVAQSDSGPAQGARAAQALAAPGNLALGRVLGTAGGNTGTDGGGASGQVILDASSTQKVGTATFGWGKKQHQVQISFSGPLDSSQEATPISLTGLGPGASATLSANRLNWRGPDAVERSALNDLCERLGMASGRMTFEQAQLLPPCDRSQMKPDDAAIFDQLIHLNDIPWLVGFDVTATQVTQKFLHPDTLDSDSSKRVIYSGSAKVGFYKAGLGFVLGSYSYAQSFDSAEPAEQVCRPLDNTTVAGAFHCQQVVIGAPVRGTSSVVTLELRRAVSTHFALSPSIQVDGKRNSSRHHAVAVQVPLYFLTTAGVATPTGGVRFGWRSDTKTLTAVIFVGSAFSILQ
jgi:hypothetical protein